MIDRRRLPSTAGGTIGFGVVRPGGGTQPLLKILGVTWVVGSGWGALDPAAADFEPTALSAPSQQRAEALAAPDSAEVRRRIEHRVRVYVRRVRSRRAGSLVDPRLARWVAEDRTEVIEALDEAAQQIPGDGWIAGHRVGMRLKQGWWGEARTVAAECEGEPWWCFALEGMVLHEDGNPEAAHAAFDSALAQMPPDVRCEWAEELGYILPGALGRRYRSADCRERVAMEARVWWLADPLHLEPWNRRRSEHLSRSVTMRLHHQTLALTGNQCSTEHHAEILARGWPDTWWSWEAPWGAPDGPGYGFLPSGEVWSGPQHAEPEDWTPAERTFERYAPDFGVVYGLDHQTAFVRRDGRVLAVAVADLGSIPAARPLRPEVGIAFSQDETEAPRVVLASGVGSHDEGAPPNDRVVIQADVADARYVVSLEALVLPQGLARSRFGHGLPEPSPTGLALSDLILLDWNRELAASGPGPAFESVLQDALARTWVREGEAVGLYWETYRLGDRGLRAATGERVRFSLTARRLDQGLLRRIASALRIPGVSRERQAVELTWEEDFQEANGRWPRAIRLDLGHLEAGQYELILQARVQDEIPVEVRRKVEVRSVSAQGSRPQDMAHGP